MNPTRMAGGSSRATFSASRQDGLSLVELMVAMTIGLVVTLALISAYLSAMKTSRVSEVQARMNEDAQAALEILAQHIRMAGNNPVQPGRPSTAPRNPAFGVNDFAIRGCDGGFSNVSTATSIANLTCASPGAGVPGALAVSYEADQFNTLPLSNGVTPTDCMGNGLTALTDTGVAMSSYQSAGATQTVSTNVTYYVADNRFYVATPTGTTVPSLYCRGSGGGSGQPMVENIEDLTFDFGLGPATGDLDNVNGYLDAAGISSAGALAALTNDAARWARVMTVRVCVVVRSESAVAENASSSQYVGCDGSLVSNINDRRLRRAYSTTVVLRNRINAANF